MIYILYGADSFRSRAKLRKIVGEYKKKHAGALDLHWFDSEIDDPKMLSEFLKSQSLFQKKKLVIVERPLKTEFGKDFKTFLKDAAASEDIVVVFWDDGAGKELAAFLKLAEPHAEKTQEYKPMSREEARKWFVNYVEEYQLNLSGQQISELLFHFSENTWQLVNEAEKAALGGGRGMPIFTEEEKIFGFLDAALLDSIGALRWLVRLRAQGTDDYYLFAALVNHVRTLLLAADLKHPPENIHPFVLRKAREKLRRLKPEAIEAAYKALFEEDIKTKIGFSDPYASLVAVLLSASSPLSL